MKPFEWGDYLKLAEALVEAETTEAYLRTAISRAYYAAFHAAKQRAEHTLNTSTPRFRSHRWTIDFFLSSPRSHDRHIGRILQRLKKDRVKADYKERSVISIQMARKSVSLAQHVHNQLAER